MVKDLLQLRLLPLCQGGSQSGGSWCGTYCSTAVSDAYCSQYIPTAGPSWSSVALRYDVAFNWSINPFYYIPSFAAWHLTAAVLSCCLQVSAAQAAQQTCNSPLSAQH
jgi:hypothetical protein